MRDPTLKDAFAQPLAVLHQPQLLGGADEDVAVGADAHSTTDVEKTTGREDPVAEVGFDDRTEAEDGAGSRDRLGLVRRRLGGVDQAPAVVDGGQEGRRHVADLLDDAARLASMLLQERLERGPRFLALAGRGKDHRLLLGIQINEYCDIVVSTLRRRFIEADRLEPAEIEPGDGLPDIVLDDAPQTLIGDADDAGGGQDRRGRYYAARKLDDSTCNVEGPNPLVASRGQPKWVS